MDLTDASRRWAAAAACTLLALAARAEMIGPTNMPAERVVKNLTEHIKKNAQDPDGYYTLARVHYALYCADDPRTIQLYQEGVPARFPSEHAAPFDPHGKPLHTDYPTVLHLSEATTNLNRAIKLDKGREPGLYRLTRACVYEAGAPIAYRLLRGGQALHEAQKKETQERWLGLALTDYLAAFDEARAGDLKRPMNRHGGTWEKWISVEAGDAILRLRPDHPRAAEIKQHLKKVNELPPAPITPLILSLEGAMPLESLLAPEVAVRFDLRGIGVPERVRWVKPETAFLVWRPKGTEPVRSGRQLFGSATWFMLFRDAYAALATLDDDGDGWLTGRELAGLALWFDRNQNGVSEPGEVMAVGDAGIVGLATRADGFAGVSPMNPAGLRLRDGRTLPTYDWVVTPEPR